MAEKILVIVGGGTKNSSLFNEEGKKLGLEVAVASFAQLEYEASGREMVVKIAGRDVSDFDVVYLRVVGKRFEDAALLTYYCRQKKVRIVDRTYELTGLIKVPLPKSIEVKMLTEAGILVPHTYFGRMKMIAEVAPKIFGYPFVIKSTTGKQGHAVWAPRNREELLELVEKFTPQEREGKARFIAQKFIKATQRNRIFVVGGKVLGGITRPTRWRKRWLERINSKFPEGVKSVLNPVPEEDIKLAQGASKAVGVEIGGVDIITEDSTGKKYVLEVNSAPRWSSFKKDTGINVEREILKYLASL